MTRGFFFASLASSLLVFLAAALSVGGYGLLLPAIACHAAVLLAFARTRRPRVRAYFPVILRPASVAIAALGMAPLGALVGPWSFRLLAWSAALLSAGAFHVEYQSVRESERALAAD